MADGTQVKWLKTHCAQDAGKIDRLVEQGAGVVLLACTGEFPEFECRKQLNPTRCFLTRLMSGAGGMAQVFIPDMNQVDYAQRRWSAVSHEVLFKLSPYGVPGTRQPVRTGSSRRAYKWQYSTASVHLEISRQSRRSLQVPVVLARSMVARVMAELL